MSKSHEEGGSYHRREEYTVANAGGQDSDYEEWTTSKRKVNHTTRQVETRVSRQLLVEDGKVIADSGPQVTTRIKEDNKVEESEKEKAPKHGKKAFEALENAPECESGQLSGRVLGEKKEIQRVSREVREENMQYHDERFKELSGRDVHRRAIKAPHELMTINHEHDQHSKGAPRGKMIHYSNKGKKYQDTDEILEVAKLAIDGSVTKEVKHTRHHEEFSEDEKPDEKGEAEALREKPIHERSSRRHVDYVNDFDDTATPDTSDNETAAHGQASRRHRNKLTSSSSTSKQQQQQQQHHRKRDKSDEAFPRYQIDPLLNSLRDEDFKRPTSNSTNKTQAGRTVVDHSPVVRRHDDYASSSSSSDHERGHSARRQQKAPNSTTTASKFANTQSATYRSGPAAVEIPEEYRVNKQRLMSGRHSAVGSGRDSRSQSPKPIISSSSSQTGKARSHKVSSASRREDASVQARLTDEEEANSEVLNANHEKTARHLERPMAAPNQSSRHYYYGEQTKHTKPRGSTNVDKNKPRRASVSSCSSSVSSSDLDLGKDKRRAGAQSRDSGFRSPAQRAQTPSSQIYSLSSKSRRHPERTAMVSPTPSAGQRSVKTTTTTMSAGLKDRPLSPEHAERDERPHKPQRRTQVNNNDKMTATKSRQQSDTKNNNKTNNTNLKLASSSEDELNEQQLPYPSNYRRRQRQDSLDTISLSSLKGPNATTIKVPYKRIIEIEHNEESQRSSSEPNKEVLVKRQVGKGASEGSCAGSEMSLKEDIENLSKRLENIRRIQDDERQNGEKKHFDYKTIVANVKHVPQQQQQHHQVIDAYNVQVIEQNSPFMSSKVEACSIGNNQSDSGLDTATQATDNNNVSDFNLDDFHFKYRAIPALVEPNILLSSNLYNNSTNPDEDRMSCISNCSLHSSKTYNIRKVSEEANSSSKSVLVQDHQQGSSKRGREGSSSKNPAWIFDPRDNSTTTIVPPPKPKKPATPEVQTEELVQAPGGRSYYLELVEREADRAARVKEKEAQLKVEENERRSAWCPRWISQGALNGSRNDLTNGFVSLSTVGMNRPIKTSQQKISLTQADNQTRASGNLMQRSKSTRQLTTREGSRINLSGPTAPSFLSDRSKSSSCLLNVTKPSKYSIYGGFRKPGDTSKPVPRLSYSRAIGPRSQRHIDPQPKLPSRYLKMK